MSASLAQWIQLVCVKVHKQTQRVKSNWKCFTFGQSDTQHDGLLSIVARLGKGSRTFSGDFVLCCYVRHREKGYKWQVFHVHPQHVGQSRAVACTINVYEWKWLTRDERV